MSDSSTTKDPQIERTSELAKDSSHREQVKDQSTETSSLSIHHNIHTRTKTQKVHTDKYFNRELSWVEFNARVLEEACHTSTPVLERLKFLSIFNNNLDEFYMVRVAGLRKMVQEDIKSSSDSPDELPGEIVLRHIRDRVVELMDICYRQLKQEVLPALARDGVDIVSMDFLPADVKETLAKYFYENVQPVLTPLAVDPAHPFPFLTNLSQYLVVLFKEVNYHTSNINPPIGLVEIPSVLPRLIPIQWKPDRKQFVLLEDLVRIHIDKIFLGYEMADAQPIRVTRNLDYMLLENEVVDLLKSVQRELTNREHQEAVRVEVGGKLPRSVMLLLKRELHLSIDEIYEIDSPLQIPGIMALYHLPLPHLKDPPFNPRLPIQMMSTEDIFSLIARDDILLHHPFDSFYPVIEFLQVAAHDPNVLAIKQTLYRSGGDSPIIEALIAAAENGKQVTAVVELKARFDEKNNISWARRLERAGVNVVFGFVGLKTHAKATLVVRKEGGKLSRYVHLGTGNYNSNTAKLYTDISLFSARPELTNDVGQIFNILTGFNIFSGEMRLRRKHLVPNMKSISIAPVTLRAKLLEMIQREVTNKKAGHKAHIVCKVNALTDKELIDALYDASQAGVDIKLIVRGMCCLRPGVKGLSENIKVTSIIDRFLEHSRIYYFDNNGKHEVFMASADMSPRNMDRRVEVCFPLISEDIKEYVVNYILNTYLKDNVKSWTLQSDGSYNRRHAKDSSHDVRAQQKFIELARDYGIKSIPYEMAIRHNTVKEKGARPVAKSKKQQPKD
ncbi:MAG: polyphosphate kinase 1 [Proteobacteria bacterium]|nr:polyphosphate kinase 1 [Pseudomonadota bacterium]